MKIFLLRVFQSIIQQEIIFIFILIGFLAVSGSVYGQKKLTASLYVDDAAMGLSGDEFVEQIAVDKINKNEEDVYLVGASYSPAFGSTYTYCDSLGTLGNGDMFLTKYTYNINTGKMIHKWNGTLKFAGSPGNAQDAEKIDRYDWAYCLTVDHQGSDTYIYVGGASLASNQNMACRGCNRNPTFQAAPADAWDGFIAKYNASDGSLIAYTYLGKRNAKDEILDIAIRPGDDHDVYVVGYTESEHMARRAAAAYDTSYNSGGDGFIAGFDNCLTTMKYYTYYSIDSTKSPTGQDRCHSLKFTSDGNQLFVSGTTDLSTEGIATFKNVYQHTLGGLSDAFVGKWTWHNSGYLPVWGTYIGGDSLDRGRKLAITDSTITGSTNVYVTGWISSKDLRRVQGSSVFQLKLAGGIDAFIVKLDGITGRGIWATYFGGSGGDCPNAINWFYSKKTGKQYIGLAGISGSPDSIGFIHSYTGTDKLKQRLSGDHDAFFATFIDSGNGVALDYATYIGGSADENYGPPDCRPNCQCLVNNAYSGYGPSIATLNQGPGTAYVSFSTNSADVADSLLDGNAGGTIYNNGTAVRCYSCDVCKHSNYDAFFMRIDMCSNKNCGTSRASVTSNASPLYVYASANPFADHASLFISAEESETAVVFIYDAFMRIIEKKNVLITVGQNQVDLNFANYPPGVYTAQVVTSTGKVSLKMIKQ